MNLDDDIVAGSRQHPFVPAYLNNIQTIKQKKERIEKSNTEKKRSTTPSRDKAQASIERGS